MSKYVIFGIFNQKCQFYNFFNDRQLHQNLNLVGFEMLTVTVLILLYYVLLVKMSEHNAS